MKRLNTEIPDHQRDFITNLAGKEDATIKDTTAYLIELGIACSEVSEGYRLKEIMKILKSRGEE